MIQTIVIASLTCLALVVTVLVKPEINLGKFSLPLYPIVALIGAICAILFTPLSLSSAVKGIIGGGAVNPIKILTLFISVTAISIFLDEAGFFEYLACKVLKKASGNQKELFMLLYITVSVLTVFTSNDVIILTFTPFIIYFCKNANVKATPYLLAEFTAANTWSMALMIGNPTNIYIATSAGIDFLGYLKVMLLPTLATGLVAFGVLYLLFFKQLKVTATASDKDVKMKDKPLCIIGLCILAVCTLSLAISGYINVEMWLECAICAGVLIICACTVALMRRRKPVELLNTLKRVPYQLIPFVISMFIISLSLNEVGATKIIAEALSSNKLILYGVTSCLACELVNNIPMSVLFSSVISAGGAGLDAVFATIIGSNLGALITPVGALAGIMFSSIVKSHGEKFSNLTFIKYGSCIALVALTVSLATLYLVL